MARDDIKNTEAEKTRKVDFSLSTIFFWVKGSIKVDSRFVKVDSKNTVFGVIPAGQKNRSIPLKNIQESNLSSSYKVSALFFGIILALIGFTMLGNSPLGAIILLLIGIAVFGSGIKTVLVVQLAGSDYTVDAPFFEKSKMLDIKDAIDEALAHEIDKTDLNLH